MKNALKAVLSVALMLLAAPALQAQNLSQSNTSGVTGTLNHASTTTFTNNGGNTAAGFDFLMTYDSTRLTITTADITGNVVGATVVCAVPVVGTISCIANANSGNLPATGTITMLFDLGATLGVTPLTFGTTNFFDAGGGTLTGTTTNGSITITAVPPGPSAPVLTYNPAPPGPIVMSPGAINTTSTGTVAVTAGTGTSGTTTALACTGSTGFTATVTGSPFSPAGTGSVNVSCTRGAAAVTGTVSCQQTPSVGTPPAANVFNVTCPLGVASPAYSSAPPPGGTVNMVGAPGATATGSVVISNTGTASLTATCTTLSAGFAVTGGSPATIAPGGAPATIGLSCVAPAAAGTTATGTLSCAHNAAGSPATYTLTCSSQLLSVPTMGLGGKALLATLLAGLGLLGFAMRRKFV